MLHSNNRGFTLIELITVLVIVAILAAAGSRFVATMIASYDEVQSRSKLLSRGRLVVEQMTRQLRSALPNSIRVSTSGNCVEFLPIVAGAGYLSALPDGSNGAAPVNSIAVSPFVVGAGTARHVAVGGLDSNEIYSAAVPAARVDAGNLSGAGPYSSIPLAFNHRFVRNSSNRRVYLADDPLRFCLIGTILYRYSNYGLATSSLSDVAPSGSASSIMAENLTSDTRAFSVANSTEVRNTLVAIDLAFSGGNNRVRLEQEVLVRNVP